MSSVATVLSPSDRAALDTHVATWVRYCRARDWIGLSTIMDDDVVMLPPDASAARGKAAAIALFEAFPRIHAFDARVESAAGHADFAAAWGPFDLSLESSPGGLVRISGKWSATYRRSANGDWIVLTDCWNADHPAQAR